MTDNKKSRVELARTIIEGVVDLVAIAGLVTLAWLKVVDGSTVVPLITLIAGASVGARLGGKKDDGEGGGGGGGGGTPASILLLVFTPLLQALGRMSRSSRVALVLACVFLAACGGAASSPSTAAVHRTLWTLLRGACAVVMSTPEPTSGGEADDVDGGVP
jgi:hypothetical protein